ncbi:uracil-xanthine permease family protein [Vibrio sp. SS-MA-C1-2]|uniref:uracil-xanthine permease family protein n=1 Tax=Vibrio sp. SS-MA-C1-2 TaxID=2908646 RepID=UPI001F4122F2|nr:uracil-xanthine permease family protein [Vibrio sp. SS-MA-C1-2]UJF16950.1 uracil-xanthine permease family protein [Vibrio sp. SS-MA-C1-2]
MMNKDVDIKLVIEPVDEKLSLKKQIIYGIQHVLVMAASPLTGVFLIASILDLPMSMTVSLISATFFVCGLGTILQSTGAFNMGAKLPFIMLPGGAPIFIFVAIATQTDVQTASGAVIMTACFYFLVLPFFQRLIKFFPPIVIGTMLLLVSIKLIKVFGGNIIGQPTDVDYASTTHVMLAGATILFTILCARFLSGTLQRLAVMIGLLAGTFFANMFTNIDYSGVLNGPVLTFPAFLPFGMPKFDLWASLPLLLFSVISMAEATGQTIATAEITGRKEDPAKIAPKTIKADALSSLIGGFFGTSLIVTSGENIGIVRATNVKSRYVTLMAGFILIFISLIAPIGRLAALIPPYVIGGTAVMVFAIIGVIGIDMLRKVELKNHAEMYTLSAGLTMGLLPTLIPQLYSNFHPIVQMTLGNGLAAGTLTALLVNVLFIIKETKKQSKPNLSESLSH